MRQKLREQIIEFIEIYGPFIFGLIGMALAIKIIDILL